MIGGMSEKREGKEAKKKTKLKGKHT